MSALPREVLDGACLPPIEAACNTEATSTQLPGVTTGIVQPIYTTLNVIFP